MLTGSKAHCILLLLVIVQGLRKAATGTTIDFVIERPPKVVEDSQKLKYVVAIDTDGSAPEPDQQGRHRVSMTGKDGAKYNCYVPATEGRNGNGSDTNQHTSSYVAQKTPSQLLDELGADCYQLFSGEDWWVYELCYHKTVRQFHQEGEEVVAQFSLGVFSPGDANTDEVQVDDAAPAGYRKFVSQVYTGGHECDLTSEHRRTEVRYVCAEDGKEQVVSIKEPASCQYVLTFAAPQLCRHPEFRVQEPPVTAILCSAANAPRSGNRAGKKGMPEVVPDEVVVPGEFEARRSSQPEMMQAVEDLLVDSADSVADSTESSSNHRRKRDPTEL